jgi:hypothetical protein
MYVPAFNVVQCCSANGRHTPIRGNAKLCFRKSSKEDDDKTTRIEGLKSQMIPKRTSRSKAQVLLRMDSFLPVHELTGQPADLRILKQ